MTINIETIETNKVKITFTAKEDQVNKHIEKALKKRLSTLSLPGFRKGKVPKQFFRKKFGIEAVYSDAVDSLVNELYSEILENKQVLPVGRPELEFEENDAPFSENQPFTFHICVVVEPVPNLGEYRGIAVKEMDFNVTEEDIKSELEQLQEKHSSWTIVEPGVEASLNNKIILDIECYEADGDEVVDNVNNFEVILDVETPQDFNEDTISIFINGFKGKKVGDIVNFNLPIKLGASEIEEELSSDTPPSYHYSGTLIEVLEKEVPEINLEFVQTIEPTLTEVSDLHNHLHAKLTSEKTKKENDRVRADLLKVVIENAEVELPQEMVLSEQEILIRRFEYQFRMYGIDAEAMYNMPGVDKDKIHADMFKQAKENLTHRLVLQAIAEKENITISAEDIQKGIKEFATDHNITEKEAADNFNSMNVTERENVLKLQKVVEFLFQNCKLVSAEELEKDA